MLQRLATLSKTVSILGIMKGRLAGPVMSVVHAIICLRISHLLITNFFNKPGKHKAIGHRFGDVELFR